MRHLVTGRAGAPPASLEATLALLLVGTSARRRASEGAIRDLAARVDYPRFTRLLLGQSLLGVTGSRLAALVGDELPQTFCTAVRKNVDVTRRRGRIQAMFTLRWASRLESAGIACLPLKGALLGERLYGDFGLRQAGDVDLLVGRDRLEEAVSILREDGFAAPRDPVSDGGLPELHFRLDHPDGELPRVELHWRVHHYEEAFSEDVLSRSFTSELGFRVGRPPDELAMLLLFFAREGLMGLRLACDLAGWWDNEGDSLPPLALQAIGETYPELQYSLATAAEVAQRLVWLRADHLLDLRPAFRRRSRGAARLANWNLCGSLDQRRTNYYLVDWLLSPPGAGGAALRRQLFRRPRPLVGIPMAIERVRCALRPPLHLGRAALGLWRIRGARSFSPPVSGMPALPPAERSDLHQSLKR